MQPSDPLGSFIGEQLQAQDRRDTYGLFAGTAPTEFDLKPGGGYGLRPSASAVSRWDADVEMGITAAAERLNATELALAASDASIDSPQSGGLTAEELAVRKDDVQHQIELEIRAQEAREESLQGAQLFRTGGPARVGPRGIGSGGFEMVRNGNWDATLNVIGDPFGFLGELPALQQDLSTISRAQAERRINDMRQRMGDAGVRNVPGFSTALVSGIDGIAREVKDYGATVDNLQRTYESYVRDQRMRETWGDDYQNLRLGKSQMTPAELEKRVLDLQQRTIDVAYDEFKDLVGRRLIKVEPGGFAKAAGIFVDDRVRTELRNFGKAEEIRTDAGSQAMAVNRRIQSESISGWGVPDNRIGFNIYAETTLARKSADTEQIQKWNTIRDGYTLIMRPSSLPGPVPGTFGSYGIPRTAIPAYNPAPRSSGRGL